MPGQQIGVRVCCYQLEELWREIVFYKYVCGVIGRIWCVSWLFLTRKIFQHLGKLSKHFLCHICPECVCSAVCPRQALAAGTSGQPSPVLHRQLCLHRGGGEAAASRSDPQPRKAAGSHPGNLPCLCTLCLLLHMYANHRSGVGLQHAPSH